MRGAVFVKNAKKLLVMRGGLCYNYSMEIREKAYAKINLTLDITGVKDGFHMLDSLVCTVDMFDLIKMRKRKDGQISIEMKGQGTEFLPPEKNNAYKAALAYTRAFETCGADITVFKNIPVGAGLGGSSADAAGVLRGMARLYGKGSYAQLKAIADALGSDTGYLVKGGFARLRGRGEIVENLDISGGLRLVLLVPDGGVSTAECYALCDNMPRESARTESALEALLKGDNAALGSALGNGLYTSAATINKGVAEAFAQLKEFAPLGVNMTGSGSGVYALCESAEMRDYIRSRYRGKFSVYGLKTVTPKF